jgi:RNA polymerase sigma-70 factor, ECF subfamily
MGSSVVDFSEKKENSVVPNERSRAVFDFMGRMGPQNRDSDRENAPGRASIAPVAPGSLENALAEHRPRLRRMVALRMDGRLQGRVDPSDVIQEAYLEAARRLPEYVRDAEPMPFFLWLRFLAVQALQVLHRKHLGVQARDAGREISIDLGRMPLATSAALAAQLLGHDTRASEAAIRAERKLRLERALNQMDPLDREVLALRHFEQLSNSECARVLGLKEATATKRYLRSLKKLREILITLPDGHSEAWL